MALRDDPEYYKKYRREYMYRRYHEDPEHKARVIANKVATVRRKAVWFAEYKRHLSCVRCGESRTPCLDFHHRDESQKELAISMAVRRWSLKRLLTEIEKCDVLCSNCHRVEHASHMEVQPP